MFPPLRVAKKNLTRAAGIAFFGFLKYDTFTWSYQRQKKNVLPIILCCQKEMDGDCVLRFPDISTSLFSHAGVSVNSAENKRGI